MEYNRMGKSGLKVSKIILGGMSFGEPDAIMPWTLKEDEAIPILKRAFELGINTWDTRIIGAALKKLSIRRERVIIMTKCFGGILEPEELQGLSNQEIIGRMMYNDGPMVNRVGLSRKHIFDAVDASIARLGTYIDVLQIHRFDKDVPMEEIMKALNDLVDSGKVRYLGASSMAAWQFQALQNVAKQNGWHRFISMQNYYNLIYREEEHEMIPYCRHAGVGVIPYSPLARGHLARPWGSEATERAQSDSMFSDFLIGKTRESDVKIIRRLEELAKKKGVPMATLALAWHIQKGVNPIVGFNSVARVDDAVAAVKFAQEGKLTDGDVQYLEENYLPKAVVRQL